MTSTRTSLRIFVGSPSDVAKERGLLDKIVNEVNLTVGNPLNMHLELIKWETHSRPGFDEDAQAVINRQIGDNYDIFLGIMWGRFGSPTKRADSGTQEEFEGAFTRFENSESHVEILMYFKDAGIAPSKSDPEQLGKVLAFKKKVSSDYGGLYYDFTTSNEFQSMVRIHLSSLLRDWNSLPAKPSANELVDLAPSSDIVVSAKLSIERIDDDDGILDLAEHAESAMSKVAESIVTMGRATEEVGEKFVHRTSVLNNLTKNGGNSDPQASKLAINNMAADLELYSKSLSVEIPTFRDQQKISLASIEKIAEILESDFDESAEEASVLISGIQEYQQVLSDTVEAMSGFRELVGNFPRMTRVLNRARNNTVSIMDELIFEVRTALEHLKIVEKALLRVV